MHDPRAKSRDGKRGLSDALAFGDGQVTIRLGHEPDHGEEMPERTGRVPRHATFSKHVAEVATGSFTLHFSIAIGSDP
ncbi:MAG: hypothetical protein RL385_137 [Pseudomonadota bacterium]|jgi:hypothetical protein